MTIAEKLATIAENQQKIYDAGYNKGLSGGGGIEGTTGVILNITDIAANQFKDLKGITKMVLPDVETIAKAAFNNSDIEVIDIGSKIQTINGSAFANAAKLNTLIIRAFYSENSLMMTNTPIRNGEGFVYVPDEYVEDYKANVLSSVANQVRPLSEIEGGGGSVEIDSIINKSTTISSAIFSGVIKVATSDGSEIEIKKAKLPDVTSMYNGVFGTGSSIEVLDVGSSTTSMTLGGYTFAYNSNLKTLIFRGRIEPCGGGSYVELDGTPILEGNGYIYVPDDLLEWYKSSSGWTDIAAQIKPISELEGE